MSRYSAALEFVIEGVIQKFTFEPGDSKTEFGKQNNDSKTRREVRVNRA